MPDNLAAEIRTSGVTAYKQTLGWTDYNHEKTMRDLEELERLITNNNDLLMKVFRLSDIADAKRTKKVGVIFSFESGSMLEGKLENIDSFRALGVLVMGLSYNLQSPFGSGTMVKDSSGLTPLGREAIARMNALGVTIDISHSDEKTSFTAVSASTKPILITHGGAAAVHPHPRNKSDALLRALAERGGVIGIYELAFLGDGSHQQSLEDYLRHMKHAVNVAGEDAVGVGTDSDLTRFDTSPASMKDWNDDIAHRRAIGVNAPGEGPPPFVTELNRSDRMEVLAISLQKQGFKSSTIEKILGKNFQRVFAATWSA